MAALLRSTRFCSTAVRQILINSSRSTRATITSSLIPHNYVQQSRVPTYAGPETCLRRHFCELTAVSKDVKENPTGDAQPLFATIFCQDYGINPKYFEENEVQMRLMKKKFRLDTFCQYLAYMDMKSHFSSDEALDLLKFCKNMATNMGYMYNEDILLQSTQHFFNKFRATGVEMDVRHYATVLNSYYILNHKFLTGDFLGMMEKDGIPIGKEILSRLLRQYCKFGEMKLASDILKHMKRMEIPLSIKLYNALILGHFEAGEPEEAMRLFYSVGEMGLEANEKTYFGAIMGCALNEDLEQVKQLLNMAEEHGFVPSLAMLNTMIQRSSEKGLTEVFDYFLALIDLDQMHGAYSYTESVETTKILIRHGNYDLAYRYFQNLKFSSAFIFNMGAVFGDMPVAALVKYIRKLKEDGYDATLTEALNFAFQQCKFDTAAQILMQLKTEDEKMKQSYIWPVINSYRAKHNVEGLKELIPLCGIQTMEKYIIPALEEFLSPAEMNDLLQGDNRGKMLKSQYIQLFRGKDTETIIGMIDELEDLDIINIGQALIINTFDMDPEVILKVFSQHFKKFPDNVGKMRTGFYFTLIKRLEEKFERQGKPLREFGEMMLELDLKVRPFDFKRLEFTQQLTDEEKKRLTLAPLSEHQRNNSSPQVAQPLIDNLNELCYRKKMTELEDLLNSVDFYDVFVRAPGDLRIQATLVLYENYVRKNTPEKAKFFYNRLFSSKQREHLDRVPFMIYMTASNLAKNHHTEEAVEVLSLLKDRPASELIDYKTTTACHLFDNKSLDEVKLIWERLEEYRVLETLGDVRFITTDVAYKYLYNVSKTCDVEEIKQAVKVVRVVVGGKSVSMSAIFTPILESGDKKCLKEVYTWLTAQYNEDNVLITLCASMTELGMLKEARNVAATPGLKIKDNSAIDSAVYRPFYINDKKQALEDFYEVIKNVPGYKKQWCLYSIWLCMKKTASNQELIDTFNTIFEKENCRPETYMKKQFKQTCGVEYRKK